MQEAWVGFLGQEYPLEKEMATNSSTVAWKIPLMEDPGRLQSMDRKESDTTEELHRHWYIEEILTTIYYYIVII